MIKSESIKNLAQALLRAQKTYGGALKDSKNPFFKSNYADLNSVIDAAVPVLNAEGIVVSQVTTTLGFEYGQTIGKSVVRTILTHAESGEYLGSDTDIVCAKQNDPQAYGSAITYARRYGLQAMTGLKSVDDDSELAMGRGNTKSNTSSVVSSGPGNNLAAGGPGVTSGGALAGGKAPSGFVTKGKMNGKSATGTTSGNATSGSNSGFGN